MSLISGHSQQQSLYEQPSIWSKLFHSVPHVNITLHAVDARFNPESDLYLESIGILASVPAAWLIATLVVLLIYLCTRCCDTRSAKKRKSRPMRCCLSLFALITCVALALGFLGNQVVHEGMENFLRATTSINSIIKHSQDMTKKYNDVLMNGIEKNLNRLYEGPFQSDIAQDRTAHFEIMDACDIIFFNISKGLEAMDELRFTIDDEHSGGAGHGGNGYGGGYGVNVRTQGGGGIMGYPGFGGGYQDFGSGGFALPKWVGAFEKYRWPATMALQGLFALFCLLLFIGAVVHSRCVLILFSVCGLFSIILLWLLSSLYVATAVALGDFCYNPTPWVMHVLYKNARLDSDITSYYLQCAPGKTNPFDAYLSKSTRAINDINARVELISSRARKYYSPLELSPFMDDLEKHTDETVRLMNELGTALTCDPIYRHYNTALVAMCDSTLFGLILMLVSVAASGLLFTILVWCNSHTWIYFKHKGRYIKVDDTDPYMPLSTIERPRLTGGAGGLPPLSGVHHPPGSAHAASAGGTLSAYGYAGRSAGAARSVHAPPAYAQQGSVNGHSVSNAPTLRAGQYGAYAGVGGGHHLASGPATLQHQHSMSRVQQAQMLGTLGRNQHANMGGAGGAGGGAYGGYQGLDNLPATMTLGRRGHYASGRAAGAGGVGGVGGTHRASGANLALDGGQAPLLGQPNTGQYATLSKQCKTLESSDFY